MPVEKKDVETMIKAEIAKITARLDALEKKVENHQTTFNQRDEERRKKLEALNNAVAAGGSKNTGVTSEDIRKAAGPEIAQIKNQLATTLQAQEKNKAALAAAHEQVRRLTEENTKRIAEFQAQAAKLQTDARLAALEAQVQALLKR